MHSDVVFMNKILIFNVHQRARQSNGVNKQFDLFEMA